MINYVQSKLFFNSYKNSEYFQKVLSAFTDYIEQVKNCFLDEDKSLTEILLNWDDLLDGRIFFNANNDQLDPIAERIIEALISDQDPFFQETDKYFSRLFNNHMEKISPKAFKDSWSLIEKPIQKVFSDWVNELELNNEQAANFLYQAIRYRIWKSMEEYISTKENLMTTDVAKVFTICINYPSILSLKTNLIKKHLLNRHGDKLDAGRFLEFIDNETVDLFSDSEIEQIIEKFPAPASLDPDDMETSLSNIFEEKTVGFGRNTIFNENRSELRKTPCPTEFTKNIINNSLNSRSF